MHALMLADLAATIGFHSRPLIEQSHPVPAEALQQYWIASRKRFGAWHQTLAQYGQLETTGNQLGMRSWWSANQAVLEEVLVSEILARVYAALGFAFDAHSNAPEFSPVTQSVYISHCEARNRTLGLMIRARESAIGSTVRLNQLRITTERWTDVLVGQIAAVCPESARYGTDSKRTGGFAEEAAHYDSSARRTQCWLLSAAMRTSLVRSTESRPVSAKNNEALCNAVLHSLSHTMFDSLGTLESPWMHRLHSGNDAADRTYHQFQNCGTAKYNTYIRRDGGHDLRQPYRPGSR